MIYYVFHRDTGLKNRFSNKTDLCCYLTHYFNKRMDIKFYSHQAKKQVGYLRRKQYYRCNIRDLKDECDKYKSLGIIIEGNECLADEKQHNKRMGN